jgi:hypothetical protein
MYPNDSLGQLDSHTDDPKLSMNLDTKLIKLEKLLLLLEDDISGKKKYENKYVHLIQNNKKI